MKKNYLFALLFSCLCFTFSCKNKDKKETEETPAPTFSELITKHSWQLTAHSNSYGGTTQDSFIQKVPCEQDDIRMYKADKTYVIDEGTIKCNPGRPSVLDEGSWEINGDKLSMTSAGSSGEPSVFRITELTDKKLIYTSSYVSFDVTFTETFTFTPR